MSDIRRRGFLVSIAGALGIGSLVKADTPSVPAAGECTSPFTSDVGAQLPPAPVIPVTVSTAPFTIWTTISDPWPLPLPGDTGCGNCWVGVDRCGRPYTAETRRNR